MLDGQRKTIELKVILNKNKHKNWSLQNNFKNVQKYYKKTK